MLLTNVVFGNGFKEKKIQHKQGITFTKRGEMDTAGIHIAFVLAILTNTNVRKTFKLNDSTNQCTNETRQIHEHPKLSCTMYIYFQFNRKCKR